MGEAFAFVHWTDGKDYELEVNGVHVPAFWKADVGYISEETPEVLSSLDAADGRVGNESSCNVETTWEMPSTIATAATELVEDPRMGTRQGESIEANADLPCGSLPQ